MLTPQFDGYVVNAGIISGHRQRDAGADALPPGSRLLTKREVLQDEVAAGPKTATYCYKKSYKYRLRETGYIIENTV